MHFLFHSWTIFRTFLTIILFYTSTRLLGHDQNSDGVPSQWKIVGVQATGGVIAGAIASCITTPIDTIKTRLQV